jgi:DNA polymerase III subunit beta
MQFTISKSELQNALAIAGKCVGQNNILPAHGNYLFEWAGTYLRISATDGERYMSYLANVDGKESLSFQLPANKINELVKLLPEQPVIISLSDTLATFQTVTGTYDFPYEPGIEYPRVKHESVFAFDIASGEFLPALNRVLFAVSDNSLFPDLNGILLDFSPDGLQYTAINGPVMSTTKQDGEFKDHQSIVTPKTVNTLAASPVDDIINISIGDTSIQVKLNDQTTLTCRLIAEKYRAYKQVIPTGNRNNLVINRVELLAALNRMRIFANEIEKFLVVTLSLGNKLELSATNLFSQSAKEQLHGNYSGEPFSLNFHAGYFISCLSRLTTENVYISFGDEKRGFIIRDNESDSNDNIMMVMPFYKPSAV